MQDCSETSNDIRFPNIRSEESAIGGVGCGRNEAVEMDVWIHNVVQNKECNS